MTGPQNYQAAERLAQKAEAHLNDGDNEGAAVWGQPRPHPRDPGQRSRHHARRVGDPGMARDRRQQAVRQLSLRPPAVGEPQAAWPAVSFTLKLCKTC